MGETVQAPTFDKYKIEGNKYLVFNGFDSELTQATVSKVYCAVYNEYDIVDVKDRNENSDDIFFIRGLVLGANFQKNAELIIKDKETNNVVSINFGYSAILGTSSSPKLAGFKVGDEIILPVKNEPGIDALDKGKVRLQFNEKLIPDKEPSKFVASSNNDISFNNESILTVSNNEELKALVTTEGNSYTYFKLTGPISFTYATADNKDYKYATLMYKVFYEDASVKTLTNVKNIAGKYVQFRQVYTTLNRGKSFGEEVLGLSKSMSLPNGIDFNDTCYTYDKDIYCVFVGGNSYYELLLISID